MQFFGLFGMASGGIGFLIGTYLVLSKIAVGVIQGRAAFRAYQIGTSPWLMLAVLLMVLGVQFFVMGLLGELTTRTYHEAQGKRIYAIRRIIEHRENDDASE
jgi:hypothetical protein